MNVILIQVLKLQACKYLADSSLEPLYKKGALPALCELDLSYGTLCQSAIEELLACCTNLTHVSLNGCINMHDLDWGFGDNQNPEMSYSHALSGASSHDVELPNKEPSRMLQQLNCVGCPNIKKVVIPHTAQCFYLSSLNLSLSANLKEVDIACSNLCFLNLRYKFRFIFIYCVFMPKLLITIMQWHMTYFPPLFSNCCSLEILKLDCPRLTSLFLQVFSFNL